MIKEYNLIFNSLLYINWYIDSQITRKKSRIYGWREDWIFFILYIKWVFYKVPCSIRNESYSIIPHLDNSTWYLIIPPYFLFNRNRSDIKYHFNWEYFLKKLIRVMFLKSFHLLAITTLIFLIIQNSGNKKDNLIMKNLLNLRGVFNKINPSDN